MPDENGAKILAIIPARGGSKGIPRKNLRILNGRPLIYYSINTCLSSKYIDAVLVSTDDEEIYEISKLYGADAIIRPPHLAEDTTTLDPVVYHATHSFEELKGKKYDYVVTIQPTSPLLTSETLDAAIEEISLKEYDTLIAGSEKRHLYWIKEENRFIPMYSERKNRQQLSPIYQETGAFLITKRGFVKENSRMGKKITIFPMPAYESVDIDTKEDWWVAENYMKKLKIVFRVDGNKEMGMGHVYRALTLAHRLDLYNEILFLMDETKKEGVKKILESKYQVYKFNPDREDVIDILRDMNYNIIINDILDTDSRYIKKLKEMEYFVVNFEDLGDGAELADVVINALYENANPPSNHYFGYEYVCLRDEFYIFNPKINVSKDVKKILLLFGGSDPSNLTEKTLRALSLLNKKNFLIEVIVGPAFSYLDELEEVVSSMKNSGFKIMVKKDVHLMAMEMQDTDLAITSNGRTIYELVSMGVPSISMSQNERESRHLFVHNSKCVKYLGMGGEITEEDIADAVLGILSSYNLRKKMRERCLKYDIRGGVDRVIRIIYDNYSSLN